MMISSHQITSLLKAYGKEGLRPANNDKVQAKSGTAKARGLDQTQVSAEARNFQIALKAAQTAPEVREAKVAELKEAIRTGNYQVSGGEIAEKMVARALVDELI